MAGAGSRPIRGSGKLIKQLNRSRILECLQQGEPLSRVELSERTGISLPAVSKLVGEMQREGLVVCVGEGPSSGGRRPMLFAYNSRVAYVIGLDVGATKTAGGVLDLEGNILATASIPTHGGAGSADEVLERVRGLIENLMSQARIDAAKVMGIGIGVPGIPDPEGRFVALAPGLIQDQSRVVDQAPANGNSALAKTQSAPADRQSALAKSESTPTTWGSTTEGGQTPANWRLAAEGGQAPAGYGRTTTDDGVVPLGEYLRRELGRPVYMENDVNAILRGEVWKGALQGAQHAVCVTVGTGIGVGLLVNGQVYPGARGSAGEIGYWLIGALGPIARSSGYGPLETFAAGPGIARRYVARLKARGGSSVVLDLAGGDMTRITARLVAEGAVLGDPLALDVWRETAEVLGVALANLCCLMDPEVLVVGGGVSRAPRELLLDPVRRIVETLVPYPPRVVPSQLGEHAGILGAVATVLDSRRSSISYMTAGVEA